MSLIQFSFSLAATKNRNFKLKGYKRYFDIMLCNEAWSQLLVMITHDLQCFIIRLILVVYYWHDETIKTTPALVFFIIRNFFMIYLEIYRIIILFEEQIKKEKISSI